MFLKMFIKRCCKLLTKNCGKASVLGHHFFIRYEIISYLINLNGISLSVKMSEKVVAPYGKLSKMVLPFYKIPFGSGKVMLLCKGHEPCSLAIVVPPILVGTSNHTLSCSAHSLNQ